MRWFDFSELQSMNGLSAATVKEKDAEKRYLLLHLIFVVSARSDQAQVSIVSLFLGSGFQCPRRTSETVNIMDVIIL